MKISDNISKKKLIDWNLNDELADSAELLQELDSLYDQVAENGKLIDNRTKFSINTSKIESVQDLLDIIVGLIKLLGGHETVAEETVQNYTNYIDVDIATVTQDNPVDSVVMFCPLLDNDFEKVYISVYDKDTFINCYSYNRSENYYEVPLDFTKNAVYTLRIYGFATTPSCMDGIIVSIDDSNNTKVLENKNKTIIELKSTETYNIAEVIDDYNFMNNELVSSYKDAVVGIKLKKDITNDIIKNNNYDFSLFKSLRYVIFEESSILVELDELCGFLNSYMEYIDLPNNCTIINENTFNNCQNLLYIATNYNSIPLTDIYTIIKGNIPVDAINTTSINNNISIFSGYTVTSLYVYTKPTPDNPGGVEGPGSITYSCYVVTDDYTGDSYTICYGTNTVITGGGWGHTRIEGGKPLEKPTGKGGNKNSKAPLDAKDAAFERSDSGDGNYPRDDSNYRPGRH